MHVLQLAVKLLTLTGIWMPEDWTQKHPKLIWILFSFVSIGLVFIQWIGVVGFMLLSETLAQAVERSFLVPSGFSSLLKIFIFVTHRKDLIGLDRLLLEDCCVPRNAEELLIQKRYDEITRIFCLACTVLANITMMNFFVLPLVTYGENRTLPFEVWLPYKVDSDLSYWLTYTHQTLGVLILGNSIAGSTVMINGLMYQVCCQFEILKSRFQRLPEHIKRFQSLKKPQNLIHQYEKKALKQNIRHHLTIFRFAEAVNETFKVVILQEFCMSSVVISASIYQLTTKPDINLEYIMVLCYLFAVLIEFLVYSWFGNELMLESLNFQQSIYDIDWTALSVDSGKDLVFVMMRASRPITMYCGHFIVLSLESYLGILKISYSVFNLLRGS